MSRINTNVSSLIGQRVLGANNAGLNVSLERLSTGLRINRGKDDPAGLIASQNLRAEVAGLGQAIKNAERADQVVNIAEGGLSEISNLLNELQALITQSANEGGLSREEREANQLQIDSILQTVDRIAGATSFQGLSLLNGNMDYATENVSGVINNFKVNGAKLAFNENRDVDVLVTASAQLAGLFLSFGNPDLNLGGAGTDDGASDQFVLEIVGPAGARELTFGSGTGLTSIVDAVNSLSDVTGVSAQVSGTGIVLMSTGYGSDEFVSVRVVDDGSIAGTGTLGVTNLVGADFNAADASTNRLFGSTEAANGIRDFGQDVEATINGIRATTKGTNVAINTDFLDVAINLAVSGGTANAQTLGAINAFTITGGGADFQLSSRVNIAGKVSLGIQNVAVRNLGEATVGINGTPTRFFLKDLANGASLNAVDGNLDAAQKVVEAAIKDVSSLRGRLGAFQSNVVNAAINSLGVSLENTTAAESVIRDTDFAAETASLTRSQILVSSATQLLQIANTQPQNALQLLG